VSNPQPGGPGYCMYVPQEQRGPVIPPGTGAPFSSPPTNRRATVEVFDPASTLINPLQYGLRSLQDRAGLYWRFTQVCLVELGLFLFPVYA
jgi:hypothetical protein